MCGAKLSALSMSTRRIRWLICWPNHSPWWLFCVIANRCSAGDHHVYVAQVVCSNKGVWEHSNVLRVTTVVVQSLYETIWWVSGFVFVCCCWIRFVTCFRCRCCFHQSWVLLDNGWWRYQYRLERWYGRCYRCRSCIFECSWSSLVVVLWAIQLIFDECLFGRNDDAFSYN